MHIPGFLFAIQWQWIVWTLLGLAAGVALVAILSPHLFSALSAWSGVWIDVNRFTKKLDKRIDIERHFHRHGRLLGALTVIAAGVLAAFSLRLQYSGQWVVLTSLGFIAAAGLAALLSPGLFLRLNRWGSHWVDTDRLIEKMERRIDIDHHILRYCRLFGMAVLGAVIVLASLVFWKV